MTYLAISAAFLTGAAILLAVALGTRRDRAALLRRWWPAAVSTGVALVLMTAVFDNLMIAAGLMTYAGRATSGVRVGLVPVEDFAYPLGGLLLLPALRLLLARSGNDRSGA